MMVICFLSVVFAVFAQDSSFVKAPTKEDYLKASRQQRIGAIVLFPAGGVMLASGVIILLDNSLSNIFGGEQTHKNEGLGAVLTVVGTGALVAGIVSAVSSHKNKLRALAMSASNQPVYLYPKNMAYAGLIPGVTLGFKLPNHHRY